MMSGDIKISSPGGLVLDDSEKGGIITGVTGGTVAANSDLQAGDDTVAATIHLDHLQRNDLQKILKVLEPYDDIMKVETTELSPSVGMGSVGLGLTEPAEMINLKKAVSLDASAEAPAVSIDGQSGKLNAALGSGDGIIGPTLNGDLPSLHNPSSDAGAKFTMPTAGLAGDLDSTLSAPNVSVSTPQLDPPKVNTGIEDYKPPKFTMPNFSLPQIKLPKTDMDASGGLDLPSVRGNLEMPNINLSDPKIDLKSEGLDMSLPPVGLNGPDVKLETPNVNMEAPSGKFKWPHLKLPKVKAPDANLNAALSTPDASLSTPTITGNAAIPDGDLNLPQADIRGPDLNVQTPNLEIDPPSGGINWPHLRLKKHKVHTPKADLDLDANLNTPEINAPRVEGGMDAPDVDINVPTADFKGPNLDMQTPNIDAEPPSGKFVWPHKKWKMRKGTKADLDIDTASLNIPTAKFDSDIKAPDAELNLPKADLPSVDVQTSDLDINAPSGKINWPHLKLKKPKTDVSKPNLNLNANLSTPDSDLSFPNTDGGISTRDVDLDLPKADVNVKAIDGDIEAPSGKVRLPIFKQLFGPKAKTPDVEAEVKAPDLSLNPQVSLDATDVGLDLPQHGVDVKAPNVDMEPSSGRFNFKKPTFKFPRRSGSVPKATGPDVDLNAAVPAPEVNLSAPTIDGEINAPDANLNLEVPKIDIDAPDVEGSSGKFKWFHFKKPKFGTLKGPKADIDTKLPGVEAPDVDLSAPDVNISAPKMEGGIENPDLNISLPNADVKDPNVDLNPSAGGLNLPKLKLKQFKGPKVKGAELDTDLKASGMDVSPNVELESPDVSLSTAKMESVFDTPDLDINLPNAGIKGPGVDLPDPEVDTSSGKFRLPKFEMPKFDFSGPNVNGPDFNTDADLKGPDLALFAPKITGDLSPPALEAGLQAEPEANVSLPDFNLSTPKVKGPDVDLNLPKMDVNGANLDLPKTDLKTTDLNLNASDLSLFPPNINGNLTVPNIDTKLETSDDTLKVPNVNLPKADLTGSDAQLNAPDLGFDSHLGDFKLSNFNLPGLGLSSPSGQPSVESGIKAPNININNATADANISVPNVPDVEPKIDVEAPKLDASLEKSKFPHFKLPSFGLSSPEVEVPIVHPSVDSGLKAPNVSIGTPTADANISVPNLPDVEGDIKEPNIDVEAPKLDASLEKSKLPHFKLPSFGLSSPEVEVPIVHPSVDSGLKAPNVSIGTPTADANISVPNLPDVEGDIKEPNIDVEAPKLDASLEKPKLPLFKLSKFNLFGSKSEVPQVDPSADLEVLPDVKVRAPSVEGEIKSPLVNASAPEVKTSLNSPELGITDAEVKGTPNSKPKWPFSWGFKSGSGTEEEASVIDSENDVEMEVPSFKCHRLPKNNIDGIGGIDDIFSLTKIDTEGKDYVVSKGVRLPVVNSTSKTGQKIDILERLKMAKEKVLSSPTEAKTDIGMMLATPSLNVGTSTEAGDSSLVRGGTFKVEKPESKLGLVAPGVSTSDENDKLSVSLSNMLGLNIKD